MASLFDTVMPFEKSTPWLDIEISKLTGSVTLQQKWKYNWLFDSRSTAWSLAEKVAFHTLADLYIWAAWSNNASLEVTGTSDFAKRHGGRGLPVYMDIRWVTADEHFTVNVTKLPSSVFKQSNVKWTERIINLDTNDFEEKKRCIGPPKSQVCHTQTTVAHEFGHAIGNTWKLGRGDEYKKAGRVHVHNNDHGSIMNSGSQLRSRHFKTILEQMNNMIPGTSFSVKTVN